MDNNHINPRTLDDDFEELDWERYDAVVKGSLFHKLEEGTLGYGTIPSAPRHRKCIPKWTRLVMVLYIYICLVCTYVCPPSPSERLD